VSDAVVVVAAARTPFGAFGGALRDMPIPELAAVAVSAALGRAGVGADEVDELAMGVNMPGSDRSIARQTALRCCIPDDRTAYTVDRACCSSLTAMALARRGLLAGEAGIAVAGGGENLSKVPYFLHGVRFGTRLGSLVLDDNLVVACPHTGVPRAVQAADEAAVYGIDRLQQDEWALRSQERAAAAQGAALFDDEIVPVRLPSGETMTVDESLRPGTTLARLSELPTVNGSSTITAGNAPGLSTGAAFAVLCLEERARREERPVLARVVAMAQVAGHPAKIGSIPAVAARAALARAGRDLDDMDLIEINEAFAAVPLVSTLVLADGDRSAAKRLQERTNVNGGAIALGHPTGATGLRLVMTAAGELRRRGGGRAVVAMCGGVGEGEAVVIEVDGQLDPA
jgi:acetyl-CoA C-acetyltransferase